MSNINSSSENSCRLSLASMFHVTLHHVFERGFAFCELAVLFPHLLFARCLASCAFAALVWDVQGLVFWQLCLCFIGVRFFASQWLLCVWRVFVALTGAWAEMGVLIVYHGSQVLLGGLLPMALQVRTICKLSKNVVLPDVGCRCWLVALFCA